MEQAQPKVILDIDQILLRKIEFREWERNKLLKRFNMALAMIEQQYRIIERQNRIINKLLEERGK